MKLNPVCAALVAGLALAAAPAAFAQSTTGGVVASGIGVASAEAIIANSNAYKGSIGALQTTYKAQFDAYQARGSQLAAQLKPLGDKILADQKLPKPDAAAIQAEYNQYQQIKQSGQQELEQIIQPVKLARQYAIEQIEDKLADATQAAMTKRRITLVLAEQAVLKHDAVYSLNQDVVDALNLILPSVSVTPPAGWLPREERAQQAQQAAAAQAQQGAATAPATARKQPQGR